MSELDPRISRRELMAGAAVAAVSASALGAPPSPDRAVADDRLRPADPGAVRLGGVLGRRIDGQIRARVMAQDVDLLLKPYRDRVEVGDGDWRCEYWGKWFTSAALAAEHQPTAANRAVLDRAIKGLLATQQPDGAISTRVPPHRLKGWDVWGRKYVLLGLLAHHSITRDPAVLEAACRHADALLAECGPGKASIAGIGYPAWKGLPPSSILEPMVLLYRRTGDARYLEFSKSIVEQWSHPSALTPTGLRLVEQALAHTPVARIDAPKAYEQTSCFEGLCELYRVTGEPRYLEAVRNVAASIMADELTVVGSGCSQELWFGGRRKQAGPVADPMETCVTATWMKFCYQLLRLTGDPMYADQLEVSLYNALLAASRADGSWWTYFTPLQGSRRCSHIQHADVGLSCCVVSGPRALMLTPKWAVMSDRDGPVVNLYCRGSATVRRPSGAPVNLRFDTDYPADGAVRIAVQPGGASRFTLKLRIPAWSRTTVLRINGRPAAVRPRPGAYCAIERTWRAGDVVDLRFDMRTRVMADPGGGDALALLRGPITLAWDRRYGRPPARDLTLQQSGDQTVEVAAVPASGRRGAWMAFAVPCNTPEANAAVTLTLCDYASAGDAWRPDADYRVWLPQPLDFD